MPFEIRILFLTSFYKPVLHFLETTKKENKQNQNSSNNIEKMFFKNSLDTASQKYQYCQALKAGCQQICQLSTLHIWIIKVLKNMSYRLKAFVNKPM